MMVLWYLAYPGREGLSKIEGCVAACMFVGAFVASL